ncbi:MAG: helix-turn-helix transcriptional regulator [Oscillospiraceae bacterium]|nr:helix-turn-helix transcriptional regulator [Oscillospiraceae bacterium]
MTKTNTEITETEECTVVRITGENGECIMTAYEVFSGITFIYSDAHIQSVRFPERKTASDNIFEISHCREGRAECKVGGEFFYLAAGDTAVAHTNTVSSSSYFPLGHYHGLTIQIDIDNTPDFSTYLDGLNIDLRGLSAKLRTMNSGFVFRANPSFEHIFSELYCVPEQIRNGYFKVKLLELLLYLSVLEIQPDTRTFTKSQVDIVKEIGGYLMEHKNERITIQQLSQRFHISVTHIKNTFKGVYGVSVGAYIRTQKMESAAYMLEYTNKTISEVASEHGYDNSSKFSAAFRSVKGLTPTEYRNERCRIPGS